MEGKKGVDMHIADIGCGVALAIVAIGVAVRFVWGLFRS